MEIEMNMGVVAASALIPLVVGFIWYNTKVFGTAWMKSCGITPEHAKGANMVVIFGFSILFSLMAAFFLSGIVIHQMGVFSLLQPEGGVSVAGAEEDFKNLMTKYGGAFRTFGHGVLHGVIVGLFFGLPIIGTNALFERRGFKYIAINVGYWVVSLGLMGGVICAYA